MTTIKNELTKETKKKLIIKRFDCKGERKKIKKMRKRDENK